MKKGIGGRKRIELDAESVIKKYIETESAAKTAKYFNVSTNPINRVLDENDIPRNIAHLNRVKRKELGEKKCTKCGLTKPLSEYLNKKTATDGKHSNCRTCTNKRHFEYMKSYKEENSEKMKEYRKNYYIKNIDKSLQYREENRELINEKNREYYRNNKEIVNARTKEWYENNKERNKPYRDKYNKGYYQKNKESIIAQNYQYKLNRLGKDDLFRFKIQIASLVAGAFKRTKFKKGYRTREIIGCEYEQLIEHMESQFTDGMSWDNKGEWHIDHIIPISSAVTEEDVIRLNHYTNLQPLWAKDNLSKGSKLDWVKEEKG